MVPNSTRHSGHKPASSDKAAAAEAERSERHDKPAAQKSQQDRQGQEAAAAHDDSKTIAREKDTSRTAALRK